MVVANSVTTLGEKAFEKNSLTVLSIGDSVTTIDLNAFNKNELFNVAFKGPFGTFNVATMSDNNTSLAKISYCVYAAGSVLAAERHGGFAVTSGCQKAS